VKIIVAVVATPAHRKLWRANSPLRRSADRPGVIARKTARESRRPAPDAGIDARFHEVGAHHIGLAKFKQRRIAPTIARPGRGVARKG
jgi:hypothetical protein